MVLRCTLLLALAAGALAVPISRSGSSCATSTCPDASKFHLQTGSTYEYDYMTDMMTSMTGASEEHSSLHMTATVQIEVLSQCEMALVLKEVDLLDSNPRDLEDRESLDQVREFRSALQANPLRFAWIDGLVEHICPGEEDEAKWVLNVKRGILSQLQNTMETLDTEHETDEIDVSGRCPVTYKRTSNGYSVDTVTKMKDMLACTDGHNYDTVFHGIPYNVESRIQSLPLMDSTHECKQDITSDGIISKVVCSEVHMFRPFSTRSSGATTTVTSTLMYKSVESGVRTHGDVSLHEYLIYDSTPSTEEMAENFRDALSTLQTICTTMSDDVRPEVPGLFARLVHDMRKLDMSNLVLLHRKAGNQCAAALQAFRDAVPNLGSTASLSLIRDLISRNEVTEMESELWLTSLSFIARPSLELLSEATALLSLTGTAGRKANLAVSSLVNNYCHMHTDCESERIVQDIIKIFEDNLSYNCKGTHEVVLMSLKALGNAGHAERSVPILNRCLTSEDVETEIRVEAIKAFRRLSCSADRSELMNMYTDLTKDSELRINAYIQVMKCPTTDVIARVRSQLEHEEINQVGSFVWTHLTNLAESSDPHKIEIGNIIMDEKLAKEFNLDKRKFSRNMEWSMFSPMLNTGGTVESNLIWSEKSFVPRSAMVNLTVDMFGHAMNLLEIGGRAEGIDGLLQRVFGPAETGNDIRSKRDVIDHGDINVLDGRYNAMGPGDPKGAMYVKVFGNEIRYEDFHDIDIDTLTSNMNYLQWLVDLSEDRNFELTKNSMFLDASYMVATISGMPLKLVAEGASTINLKMNGKMDLRSLMSNPMKVDIDGTIEPSAAIEITSNMGIDAHVAKTGLKMVSTLHTSTQISGKLQMEGGKILSFDFNVPREKLEIFQAKSTFYVTHRGQEREQRMLSDTVYTKSECLDLVKSMGVEICAEASVPLSTSYDAPLTPFTGPISLEVYGMKHDTFDKYHFEMAFDQEKQGRMVKRSVATLVMDTPGSRVNREVACTAGFDHVTWDADMAIRSPWKQIQFNADLTNEDTLKGLDLVAMVDEDTEYSLRMSLPIEQTDSGFEMSPEMVLTWPELESPTISGTWTYIPARKIDFNVQMHNIFSEPAKASGSISMINNDRRQKLDVSVNVQAPRLNGQFTGFIDKQGVTTSSRLQLEYTDSTEATQSWTLNTKVKDQSTNTLSQYVLDSQWTSTVMPDYNGDLNIEVGYGKNTMVFNVNTGFDDMRRIILKESASWKPQGVTKTANGEFIFQFPLKDIDYMAKFDHMHNKDELSMKYELGLGDGYDGLFEAGARWLNDNPDLAHITSNVKLHYPGREFELTEEIQETAPGVYSHHGRMQLQPNFIVTVESVIKVKPDIEITSTINYPNKRPISLEANIKPVLNDLLIKGSMDVEGDIYSMEATMKSDGDSMQTHSTTTFDLVYPSRHITSNSEYNYNDGVINGNSVMMWDADNDRTKQTSTVYRMTISASNPAMYIKSEWYPQQFVEIDASAMLGDTLSAELVFNNKLPVDMEIAEEWKFGVNWEPQQDGGILHLEGSADGRKAEMDVDYMMSRRLDKHAVTLDIKTPFTTYRTIKVETSHDQTPKSLDVMGAFGWDDKEVRLVSENNINWRRKTYNGGITFTSHWEGLENVRITTTHKNEEPVHTTEVAVSWGPRAGVSYNQQLHIQPGTKFGIASTLTTPFDGYEELKLDAAVEKSGDTVSTNNEFQWARGKMITLVSSLTRDGYEMDGNFRFTTPFESMERFVINANNAKQGNLWVTHVDLEYAPNQKIELDTQMDLDNYKKMYIVLKCEPCPYVGTTSFDAEMTGNLMKHTMKVEMTNTQLLSTPITMTTDVDVRNLINGMQAELHYRSPVGLTTMDIIFTHTKRGRVYDSELTFTIPSYTASLTNEVRVVSLEDLSATTVLTLAGDEYRFVTSIKGQPRFEVSVMLHTPSETWPQVGFELTHEGVHTDFTTTFDVTYGSGHKMTSSLKYANTQQGLEVLGEIQGLLNKDFKVELSRTGNEEQMDINCEFHYGQTEQIPTDMSISLGRSMDSVLNRILPILNKEVMIKFTHMGSILDFTSNLEIDVNNEKVTTVLNYAQKGARFGGSIRITTPWESASTMFLEMNHRGPLTKFKNDFTWQLNDRTYRMENEFEYSGNRLSIGSKLTTPIEGYETITANWVHSGTLSNFQSSGDMDFAGQSATFTASFEMGDVIKATMALTTPFEVCRSLTANLEHSSRNMQNFNSDLDVTLNGQQYRANLLFKWQAASLRLEASANTPDNTYGINVRHRGARSDFETTITITCPDGEIQTVLAWKKDNNGVDSALEITSPYKSWRSITMTLKHEGSLSAFENMLTWTTPWEMLPSGSVAVNHHGGLSDWSNDLTITVGSTTLAGTSTWVHNDRQMEGSVGLTLPIHGMEDFGINFGHVKSDSGFTTTGGIQTSLTNFASQSFEVVYSGPWTDLETSITLTCSIPGRERFMASATNKMTSGNLEMSVKVETPIEGYNDFELTVSHNGPLTNFVSRATVVTSIRGSRRMSAEVRNNMENGIQSSFNIRTPWEVMREMGGELSHVPRADGFDLTVSVTTPFPKLENQMLTVTHTKQPSMKDFTTDVRLQWGTNTQHMNCLVEYVYGQAEMTASVSLTSSLPELETILNAELTHKSLSEGFESKVSLTTPWVPTIEGDVTYNGVRTNFEATANLRCGSKRMETECAFRMDETMKSVDWKLKRTPWEMVENFEIVVSRERQPNGASGTLGLTFNSNEMIDLDFGYTKMMPYNLRLTMRKPVPLEGVVNCNTQGQTHTADITVTYNRKTMTANYEMTDRSDYYTTDKKMDISAVMPTGRQLSYHGQLYMTDLEVKHEGVMEWQTGKQASWNLELTKATRRGQYSYSGVLSLTSPLLTRELTINHVVIGDRQYTTTISVPRGITITNDIMCGTPTWSHILHIEHPTLRRGMKSEIVGTWDTYKMEIDVTQFIEDEEFTLHARVEDETTGLRERLVWELTAKNPAISMDTEVSSMYVNNHEQMSWDMELKHMTSYDRQMKNFKMTNMYNKMTNDISMTYQNPMHTINWVGRMTVNEPTRCAYELVRTWNDKVMTFEVGHEDNSMYCQVSRRTGDYTHDDLVRVVANYNGMRDMNIEMFHSTGGEQTRDLNLGISENRRTKMINARTFIRDNIALDFGNYMATVDMSDSTDAIKAFFEGVMEDRSTRIQMVKRKSLGNLKETLQKMAGEQMEMIQTTYTRMMRDNEMYISDIHDYITTMVELCTRKMEQMSATTTRNMEYYQNRMGRYWNAYIIKLNERVNAMNDMFRTMIEEYWPEIQEFHAKLEKLVHWLDEMVNAISNHPYVQSYYATLEKIKTGEFMRTVREWRSNVEAMFAAFEEKYQIHLGIVRDLWENLQRRAEVRELAVVMEKICDWLEYMNENYNIEETIVSIATKLSEMTWDVVKDRMYYAIKSGIDKSSINVWDPQNAHLEVDMYIPTDFMMDIQSGLPDFYIKDRIRKILYWIETNMPSSEWTFMDYYYYYKPACISELVPPFKSWATVAGTQHYMTFDKKFYEFAGECSYLLARDFIDRKFAVVVNYDSSSGMMKKSITVTDGRSQVEITPSGEVHKDGSNAELPLVMDATTIVREGNMINIINKHGVDVMCDLIYDRCTVEVTGWYYGKTAGLMGTYDNEPLTDFVMSDGTVTDDVVTFADSWTVGRCSSRNMATVQEPIPGTRPYELCSAHFMVDASPFRPCFKIVDPAKFMKMCVNDFASRSNAMETVEGTCMSGAFYVDECSRNGVTIRMPTDCVKCHTESRSEYVGEITLEARDVPQSADVVFVVQHAQCNAVVVENLREIMDDLDSMLVTSGLRDNRYGVVGYGSTDRLNMPHSHTMDGQLFNTHEKFVQGIQSWMDMTSGDEIPDTLDAIQFAAKYPFRTGVSKTIVVIPCEMCDEVDISYSAVQKVLVNKDIRLHAIMDHEFTLKGNMDKPNTAYLYGSDKNGIFTKKHMKGDLESDRELYHSVKLPGDLCSSLSHSSDGAVFDVNQFTAARKTDQKRFAQVMVRVIADRATPSECQYCQCVADCTGAGVSICRSCSTTALDYLGLYPDMLKFDQSIFDFSFSDII